MVGIALPVDSAIGRLLDELVLKDCLSWDLHGDAPDRVLYSVFGSVQDNAISRSPVLQLGDGAHEDNSLARNGSDADIEGHGGIA